MFLFLLLAVTTVSGQVCTQTSTTAAQNPITLYSYGIPKTASYAHMISASSTFTSTATGYALTAAYTLSATTLSGPATDCSLNCLTQLWLLTYKNNTANITTVARYQDASAYPGFTNLTSLDPLYCASALGNCGADTELFLYYDSNIQDYYVSTSGGGPDNSSSAYSLAPISTLMPGSGICYGWSIKTTTTSSTGSTTTYTGSTTTYTGSTTTYTGSTTKSTGSTTANTGSTTTYTGSTTTTKPYTGTSTTTTPFTGTTTKYTGPTTVYTGATTASSDSTGSTSSSVIDQIKGSSWWKWVLIALGVILIAGVIIGLLGLVTLLFINPQPAKRNVTPYSPNSNVLPPQPVQAAPTPQPFTVGPTAGGYPPGF